MLLCHVYVYIIYNYVYIQYIMYVYYNYIIYKLILYIIYIYILYDIYTHIFLPFSEMFRGEDASGIFGHDLLGECPQL